VHVLRRIFISREEMELKYGAAVNSHRRYFYYILRCIELVKNYSDIMLRLNKVDDIEIVNQNQALINLKKSLKSD
jgi:hypothetical protein